MNWCRSPSELGLILFFHQDGGLGTRCKGLFCQSYERTAGKEEAAMARMVADMARKVATMARMVAAMLHMVTAMARMVGAIALISYGSGSS